jgi:hypothetical protein
MYASSSKVFAAKICLQNGFEKLPAAFRVCWKALLLGLEG